LVYSIFVLQCLELFNCRPILLSNGLRALLISERSPSATEHIDDEKENYMDMSSESGDDDDDDDSSGQNVS